MRRPYIPILVLFLAFNLPSNLFIWIEENSTAVIPGWHTTIDPSPFVNTIFPSAMLLMISILYWKVIGSEKVSIPIFIGHMICTLPALIFIKFSLFYFLPTPSLINVEDFNLRLERLYTAQLVSHVLFAIAQVLLAFYLLRIQAVEISTDE